MVVSHRCVACRDGRRARARVHGTPGKAKRDKHIALMFYNYPPGKANIGASYLNVAESLAHILRRLAAEGYDLGGADLSSARVLDDITKARNVGGYAPGELRKCSTPGRQSASASEEYRRWLDELAPSLREKILQDWGPPEKDHVDATRVGGLVIPMVRYGNVILLPQPSRGWGEDAEKMYHAKDLAPHHQYVGRLRMAAKRIPGRCGRPRRHPRHARMAGRQGQRAFEGGCARRVNRRSAGPVHLQRGCRR